MHKQDQGVFTSEEDLDSHEQSTYIASRKKTSSICRASICKLNIQEWRKSR